MFSSDLYLDSFFFSVSYAGLPYIRHKLVRDHTAPTGAVSSPNLRKHPLLLPENFSFLCPSVLLLISWGGSRSRYQDRRRGCRRPSFRRSRSSSGSPRLK